MLGKSSWYKKKPKEDLYDAKAGGKGKKNTAKKSPTGSGVRKKAVIFVEQSAKGELASNLREMFNRIEGITGLGVKVVERAGSSLKSLLPVSMGEDAPCGRKECVSCNQGS